MSDQLKTPALSAEDERLIHLVDSVLTDPNLHTETRMRLHEQIAALLADAAPEGHPAAQQATASRPQPEPPGDPKLSELLGSVLVDPNLHTDSQMRLYEEIPALIRAHTP